MTKMSQSSLFFWTVSCTSGNCKTSPLHLHLHLVRVFVCVCVFVCVWVCEWYGCVSIYLSHSFGLFIFVPIFLWLPNSFIKYSLYSVICLECQIFCWDKSWYRTLLQCLLFSLLFPTLKGIKSYYFHNVSQKEYFSKTKSFFY